MNNHFTIRERAFECNNDIKRSFLFHSSVSYLQFAHAHALINNRCWGIMTIERNGYAMLNHCSTVFCTFNGKVIFSWLPHISQCPPQDAIHHRQGCESITQAALQDRLHLHKRYSLPWQHVIDKALEKET